MNLIKLAMSSQINKKKLFDLKTQVYLSKTKYHSTGVNKKGDFKESLAKRAVQ